MTEEVIVLENEHGFYLGTPKERMSAFYPTRAKAEEELPKHIAFRDALWEFVPKIEGINC